MNRQRLSSKCKMSTISDMGKHTSTGTFPTPLVGEGLGVRGATHTNMPPLVAKAAFTLAEVLITLAIIGVVAALTLPTLIAKVNEKVDGNQKKVTEAKLIQGLNMLDLHGGINNTYSSTAEFAEELSKYMKITKICDGTSTQFRECIPYSEIIYNNGTEDKTVEITKLNTTDSLGLGTVTDEQEFMAPVAMVLADGTPMFLTYNKKCISDPDSIKSDNKKIHSCVDGLYDLNGSRMPNRVGKDLTAMNKATINISEAPAILATIGDIKIIKLIDKANNRVKCSDYINQFDGITYCPYENDYWVGALVTCRDMGGHLPSMEELAYIARQVYHTNNISAKGPEVDNLNIDQSLINKLGLDFSDPVALLANEDAPDTSANGANGRVFAENGTWWSNLFYRNYSTNKFICVANE